VPAGFERESMREFEELARGEEKVDKGKSLFRFGDHFEALFAIRTGSFKTTVPSEDGHEQITGYHLPGDVIGTDGIDSRVHSSGAISLEDSVVCTLPFDELAHLALSRPLLQHRLYRLLSHEVARDHASMVILGSMRAENRVARFLLDVAGRKQVLGYSSCEFLVRMTRGEIGSLLGLQLETVSRMFSHLHREGVIHVQGRLIKVLDRAALQRLAGADSSGRLAERSGVDAGQVRNGGASG